MSERSGTIVVGYDASDESMQAVRLARRLAGPHDRILVLTAWELPFVVGYGMVSALDPAEIEAGARRSVEKLIAAENDDRLEPIVSSGRAGNALAECAAGADMVVVGHRGNGRASMILGSTANHVIHHTDRPVVVARGASRRSISRVVVGVDAGECPDERSVRALRWAMELPGVEDVEALHGWSLPPLTTGTLDDQLWDAGEMDAAALTLAERVVAAAGPPPDDVSVLARSKAGDASFVLIQASRDADLVVVGRRGRGGFAELLLGSTSTALAAHSHCPVAIIR